MTGAFGAATTEPYWHGVRRRLRSGALIALLTIANCLICYAAVRLTGSIFLAIIVGVLGGIVSERVDSRVDPISTEPTKRTEKRIWSALFIPALLGMAGVLIFRMTGHLSGTDVVGTILLAQLLGFATAATFRLLATKSVSP